MKILNIVFFAIVAVACKDSSDDDKMHVVKNDNPLSEFSVKVGETYHHAIIDQTDKTARIAHVVNGNSIEKVQFVLQDKATIDPNPNDFLNNWVQEQKVVVTTEGGNEVAYTVVLPDLVLPEIPEDSDAGNPEDYVFFDDFNVDGIPDQSKWILAEKASSDWNDEMSESYDQAYVKDGKLILVAEKKEGKYLAGGIKTEGKFSFTFGKLEVKARITQYPNGAFPAIWLMPSKYIYKGWPGCGEIDVMEHIKQESHIYHTIHTHYTFNLKQTSNPRNHATYKCDFEEYNVYGMEWTPDEITFFVNGVKTFSYPNQKLADELDKKQWPFTKDSAFYIILNMGLGGDRSDSWAGPIDDDNLPAIMEVDWVRVSELNVQE